MEPPNDDASVDNGAMLSLDAPFTEATLSFLLDGMAKPGTSTGTSVGTLVERFDIEPSPDFSAK